MWQSNSDWQNESRGMVPSTSSAPPPPRLVFFFSTPAPVSDFCGFVSFGPHCLTGPTQPWGFGSHLPPLVSCQMVSCTCCLKQGGPATTTTAATATQPMLEHLITASKMITLFTHAHTHSRWLFSLTAPSPRPPALYIRTFYLVMRTWLKPTIIGIIQAASLMPEITHRFKLFTHIPENFNSIKAPSHNCCNA